MPFGPRAHPKMLDKIPPVRMTTEERQAVDWLTRRLGGRAGVQYTVSDTVRAVLAEALRREMEMAEMAGDEVPTVVRSVL